MARLYDKIGVRSERTRNISNHILLSVLFKGGGLLSSFLMVPLALSFLDQEKYGVWLTVSSFIIWFSFFDIGLGNGLRNRFTEAKTSEDFKLAQAYVSSAYFTLALICAGLFLLFLIVNSFLDWTEIFNTSSSLESELFLLMPIIVGFFCIQLVAKLIVTIYVADQRQSQQDKVNLFVQVSSLMLVWTLSQLVGSSLLLFGVVYSAVPVLVLLLLNLFAFRGRYRQYKPTFSMWQKKYTSKIFGLGLNFFLIQIAAFILLSSDNFIISLLFGPEEVVPYSIALKYFNIAVLGFSVLVTPFWSGFTEAYAKKEFDWIKLSVRNILRIWLVIPLLLAVMLLMAEHFYKFWLDDQLEVPFMLSALMAVFALITTFNLIFVNFINGVGKTRVQLLTSIVTILSNIPLSIFFAKTLNMGTQGVILATCVCLGYSLVLRPLQYHKIINGTAKGIWAR